MLIVSFLFLRYFRVYSLTHLKVLDALADSLHLTGTLQAQDDGRLRWRVDGSQSHHQILEVQTAEEVEKERKKKRLKLCRRENHFLILSHKFHPHHHHHRRHIFTQAKRFEFQYPPNLAPLPSARPPQRHVVLISQSSVLFLSSAFYRSQVDAPTLRPSPPVSSHSIQSFAHSPSCSEVEEATDQWQSRIENHNAFQHVELPPSENQPSKRPSSSAPPHPPLLLRVMLSCRSFHSALLLLRCDGNTSRTPPIWSHKLFREGMKFIPIKKCFAHQFGAFPFPHSTSQQTSHRPKQPPTAPRIKLPIAVGRWLSIWQKRIHLPLSPPQRNSRLLFAAFGQLASVRPRTLTVER